LPDYSLERARTPVHRLGLRKFPGAVQDFGARTIEPHQVVPALHGRQAIGNLAVTTAELDDNSAVCTFPRRDVVEAISVVLVPLVVTLGIVETDGPEAVDRYVP